MVFEGFRIASDRKKAEAANNELDTLTKDLEETERKIGEMQASAADEGLSNPGHYAFLDLLGKRDVLKQKIEELKGTYVPPKAPPDVGMPQ